MRTSTTLLAAAAIFAAMLTTSAFANSGVGVNPSAGNILVDDRGMSLYRFTADQLNASACYGGCAQAWPPVLADAVPAVQDASLAAGLGLASRTDGNQQLTFQGSPLYYFIADRQPGDANGQGVDGEWFTVTLTGN
jgi:predicted lipoprotein with Yx(FWY)xxD motif